MHKRARIKSERGALKQNNYEPDDPPELGAQVSVHDRDVHHAVGVRHTPAAGRWGHIRRRSGVGGWFSGRYCQPAINNQASGDARLRAEGLLGGQNADG